MLAAPKRQGLRTTVTPKIYFDIENYVTLQKKKKVANGRLSIRTQRRRDFKSESARDIRVRTAEALRRLNGSDSETVYDEEFYEHQAYNDDMASSSGGSESNEVIICINCRQLIQYKLHVNCCECSAVICIDCFSYGCEAGSHVRGHNYEICDPLGGRTFDARGSWGALEEKKLLAAAYRYKLGNWGEVTKLMDTSRPVSQVQEYYDRFFIRGPIGQLALKRLTWEETKKAMIADRTLFQQVESDRITYLLIVIDALRDSKIKLDPESPNLVSEVDDLMQKYMSRLHLDADEHPALGSEQAAMLDEAIDLALSDDSCDPSDVEEGETKKVAEDSYLTGLEPENDSDEEDTNMSTPSATYKTMKNDIKTDNKCVRKSSRQSTVLLRPSKVKVRCGLRKSTLEKCSKSSRYRRVVPESSSTDEESVSADEVENMETDQASVDDSHEPTHGLEKEHSTDEYTASESESAKRPPHKQFNSNSVRKKRRARFITKKARRLKEFQKRMARMNRAAEKRLNELSDLCPAEEIRALRDTKPNLALYSNDYFVRPKVRQSDMDMLAYNAARNDFEWEWYNDAEQLISRLMVQESSDKIEDLENDIKFARLERYFRILKTRKAFRRAIVEHDKIPEFFKFMMNMTMEKRKASQIFEQRTPIEKLLARAQQCLTKKEVEDLRNHLERTNELMDRISKLQELQRSGVTTLKEAVFLLIALCWTRSFMDSLPSLLFIETIMELYLNFALSSSLLLLKKYRCSGLKKLHRCKDAIPCSLESSIGEEVVVLDVVFVGGPTKPSLSKLRCGEPVLRLSTALKSFQLTGRIFSHINGGISGMSRDGQSSSSSSQSVHSHPVNVDAVLGANTVEDIADAHPDFARLLLDCYSAGCDLEEYKREFQRLKNLRIKRQGGVNQTLSFSLFPSVPSDLPGHLFVRLMKFHSLYEGACRKYLADVVNRRAEASSAYSYDLSAAGVQDLMQNSMDYGASTSSISYSVQDFQFTEPTGLGGHSQMTADVTYSPALNSAHTHMRRVSHSNSQMMADQQGMSMVMESDVSYMQREPLTVSQGTIQQHVGSTMVDRRLTATPLPTWSVQQTSVNAAELRSRMATPLPPLEIRQCPVLQPVLATPVARVESRAMQTPVQHMQSRLTTPVASMESRQDYVISGSQSQQYSQMRSASVMHVGSCADNRGMTATPMIGAGDSSVQGSPFATPTKKPRARRKVVQVSGTNLSQSQQNMALQGRQLSATPIPGWQTTKQSAGVQGQSIHVQNRAMMSASVTPLPRQLTTPAPEHREMMTSTPLPGWGSHQVAGSSSQVEHSPLVSSLPPLSQFTSTPQHSRHLKAPYPTMQARQLTTPAPQSQSCEVVNQHSYEPSPQMYSHSRDMMTPAPFAQAETVSVPYPRGQNMATPAEMYSQTAMPSYQWSEGSTVNVFQQGQYVQQNAYNQQSQFAQQINTGNQQQVAFVGAQSSQYSSQSIHSQQTQYPQGSSEIQKVSAFSQPYSYVQQAYAIPTYQQQTSFSQDSPYTHANYPQRSPYAQQQTEKQPQRQSQSQQQNHTIQQHLSQSAQQQQPIQRQVYENSAQYAGQFIPTYTTQPACGMQNAQHGTGTIHNHQIQSSCEVVQHASDIQQQTAFTTAMLDMGGPSTGTIGDMLPNRDALTAGESLDVTQGDNNYSSIPEATIIDPMLNEEIRTFGITQVPPPPRNDSEATVPARTSPNSCSPGLGGDDETSSLIPTIFYPSTQSEIPDLRIQDSPVEKGLNCQHFRFDIILAMKHHRIEKEDYERTLQELDQMEKEKCVGPLGDMLMRRLGLKRQPVQGRGGKFSVDELVAAFAANAAIRDRVEKVPQRRDSSELFSEILNEITPSSSGALIDPFNPGAVSLESPPALSLQKTGILQSGDPNDLGFLLSDDVIAEFDSMSKAAAKQVQKPIYADNLTVTTTEKQSSSISSVLTTNEGQFPSSSDPGMHLSSAGAHKEGESQQCSVYEAPAQLSSAVGQPAVRAHRPVDGHCLQSSASRSFLSAKPAQLFADGPRVTVSPARAAVSSTSSGDTPSRKTLSEAVKTEKLQVVGAPALPARRSDIYGNSEFDNLSPISPVVISPEPLSDEPEWWQKDEKASTVASSSTATDAFVFVSSTSSLQHHVEDPTPLPKHAEPAIKSEKKHQHDKVRDTLSKQRSRSPEHISGRKSRRDLDELDSYTLSRSAHLKNSDGEEYEPSTNKLAESTPKKSVKKSNKYVFGSDSSLDESGKEESCISVPSTSRHHSAEPQSSLPSGHSRRSRSPHSHHSTSPHSFKKKSKKTIAAPKPSKESSTKLPMSKADISREVLARQISEIIEEERCKLSPAEIKQLKRPLSPATLDVVIQDLMQHHISEDTSPNRELFASKLLGTELFSKLFFRAGKSVFRHYEELDDLSRKDKGRGTFQKGRKTAGSRKRDTELLRGIRKSREIQKYRDAVRAAKEPSEAEKAAAAERAKLEAMPWLARSTFKPQAQQGVSTRFVIPKKSSSGSGARQTLETSRDSSSNKYRSVTQRNDSDVKSSGKVEETASEYQRSAAITERTSLSKRSRSPPDSPRTKSHRSYHEERVPKSLEQKSPVVTLQEVTSSFSFVCLPKSGLHKSKLKHTWPLKRWRSFAASFVEPMDFNTERFSLEKEPAAKDSVHVAILGHSVVEAERYAESNMEKSPAAMDSSIHVATAEYVSATEAELAAMALQEELSRSEQGSPDDQFEALRYLAAMPESEFQVASVETEQAMSGASVEVRMAKPESSTSTSIPPVKLLSPERTRVDENQFEQVEWIRIEHAPQTFFSPEFDADPWRLPLPPTDSLTPKHVPESPNLMTTPSSSLYVSLQEELDTIVKDTLGDTEFADPAVTSAGKQLSMERFEWPKADVPVRSYCPDVVLPKLMCDKSRIPIVDMCRCQRCQTRCEYFCDDEEWKYLYDCAVFRRKEKQQRLLVDRHSGAEELTIDQNFSMKPDRNGIEITWRLYPRMSERQRRKICFKEEACSVTKFFLKEASHLHTERSLLEYQHISARQCAKFGPLERVCSTTQNFLKRSDRCHVEHWWPIFQRVFDAQSLRTTSASPRSCAFSKESASLAVSVTKHTSQQLSLASSFNFEGVENVFVIQKVPCKEEAKVLLCEARLASNHINLSTDVKDLEVVLHKKREKMNARTVLPIHQRILIRCSMSAFSEPLDVDLCCDETSASQSVTVPITSEDTSWLSVAGLSLIKAKASASSSTSASINIPRTFRTSLSVVCTVANYGTPAWVMENSRHVTSMILSYAPVDATILSVCHLNVKRERPTASLGEGATLAVAQEDSSSLMCYSSTPEFMRSGAHLFCEITLPLPVRDTTFYASNFLRVRRRRPGFSTSANITLPIPRLISELLSICEVSVDRRRRAFSSKIAVSITIPRCSSESLAVCDASFEQNRDGLSLIVSGEMPIPRMECTVINVFKLNVKRKRLPLFCSSETVINIPRNDVASFSVADLLLDSTRADSESIAKIDIPIPREEDTILRILEMRVKRRRKPFLEKVECTEPTPRLENEKLSLSEATANLLRPDDQFFVEYAHPIPRQSDALFSILDRSFEFTEAAVPNVASEHIVDIPTIEGASTHIYTIKVRRSRKQQSCEVGFTKNYSEFNKYSLLSFESSSSLFPKRKPGELEGECRTVVDIPQEDAEELRISTLRMSRKRKHAEEEIIFVKKLALEESADLFLTEKSFCSGANRFTEIVYVKDPRLPETCSNTFMEVSSSWRNFAHQHLPHFSFSSYMVTQLATLLQRVFSGALNCDTITLDDLHRLLENKDGKYDTDVLTNPQKLLSSEPVTPGPLWDRLMKLRSQRNSTELLDRKLLSPLYIFLGVPNIPRVGKPWRKWLKPLEPSSSDSRIGWQLALCMRIPDLVGVDDMDCKMQAIKMWWTVMMLRGTISWTIYPCFSRRQLFILVRLLEAIQGVDKPPFSLYPPKAFFKAVKKILRHPRIELIPKDIYHPDVTIMATLLKTRPNRVFQVDRSLPELLSSWLDDMNKIDAYLASDVDINPIPSSKFLTMTEWAWVNYNQGCAPEWIEYDRSVNLSKTLEQLNECLNDVSFPLEQRRRISMLKNALNTFSKFESGPDLNQVPIDIINPFALSPSLISMIPMPYGFVEDCFAFLEEVAKRSSQPRQNQVKRSTKNLLSWKWKPSERLASVGKLTSDGTKANGKTTISTIFEEFWRQKEFSTVSSNSRGESMTHETFNPHLSTTSHTDNPMLEKQNSTVAKRISTLAKPFEGRASAKSSLLPVDCATSSTPPKSVSGSKVCSSLGPSALTKEKLARFRPAVGLRKRKESITDGSHTKSTSIVSRPIKKSRLEMRKRVRARGSDESGPSAKQHMEKIPEHRIAKLRHTLARRGMETERMVHETVLRACAIASAQRREEASLARLPLKRRAGSYSPPSLAERGVDGARTSFKTGKAKKRQHATIFDVANFEYVLEMSLRRPRAFVDLYKTMKYQYRILEKRRWVERNRRLYDAAQFDKFMLECSHSEAELIEKAKLLKAERDMENVLGVTRADAEKMGRFAAKDLAHWYSMNARYAREAETLARRTLEDARKIDDAIEEVMKKEEEAEEMRLKAARDHAIQSAAASTLKTVVDRVVEREGRHPEKINVKAIARGSMVYQRNAAESYWEYPKNDSIAAVSPYLSDFDADAAKSLSLSTTSVDAGKGFKNLGILGNLMDIRKSRYSEVSDKAIPPLFHMQSRLPITSSFIAVLLNINLQFTTFVAFEPRFKRPRRVDHEPDLLPPGDFSPYSTDDEWEEYYEKKERFENHHPSPPQFSWKSCGRAHDEAGEEESEPVVHGHCDCGVAYERAVEWVNKTQCHTLWRSFSAEELTQVKSMSKGLRTLPFPLLPRSHSALSCVSLEKLPILEPAVLNEQFDDLHEYSLDRKRSISVTYTPHEIMGERAVSVPPSWKPLCSTPQSKTMAIRRSICESRRDRHMYSRNLSACRYRVYGIGESFAERRLEARRENCSTARVPTHREEDPPEQWVRRCSFDRHDLLKTVRFWLEGRVQHNIPVVWSTREDQQCSPVLIEEIDDECSRDDNDDEDSYDEMLNTQPAKPPDQHECPLEYPIPVYNPPPTWNMLVDMKRKENRIGSLSESLEHPSEPSAFQRVLQRPQPIDINQLDITLDSDDESEKIPNWPLLKKLRDMERELLAAGNPIAIERQKIREYNRKLRIEMQERGLGEQLCHLQQLYMDYFTAQQLLLTQVLSTSWISLTHEQQGLLDVIEQQQDLDQRWYSLLRDEQELTCRLNRDAVLANLLSLRTESHSERRQIFSHIGEDDAKNFSGFQEYGINTCGSARIADKVSSFKQPASPTEPVRGDDETIEVNVVEAVDEIPPQQLIEGEQRHQEDVEWVEEKERSVSSSANSVQGSDESTRTNS